MSFRIMTDSKTAQGCSLLWTADEEPLAHASKLLQQSGVRVLRIDERKNLIEGKVGRWNDPYRCRVMVRLFPNTCNGLSLVEIECRGSYLRPMPIVLAKYIELLRENFENTMPDDMPHNPKRRASTTESTGDRLRAVVTEMLSGMSVELPRKKAIPPEKA